MIYIQKKSASSWSSFKKKTDTGAGEKRYFIGSPSDQELISLELVDNGKKIKLVFDGSQLVELRKLFSQFEFYRYVKANYCYPEARKDINEDEYQNMLEAYQKILAINETYDGTITNDGTRVYIVSTVILKAISQICPPDVSGIIITHLNYNIYNLIIYFDSDFLRRYKVDINFFNFSSHLSLAELPRTFYKKLAESGLRFNIDIVNRFIASLCTKPFLICSGLSGSGKTKLAQAFVQWISESDKQYKIIPVGADWTNREPLLGYPNGLEITSFVTPDSGALQLILEASKKDNHRKPYFMILDEMNLSHVERYFADFLSIMESGDSIKLYSGADRVDADGNKIKQDIIWPKNLFIIGTVNIDETTYMFSPKVLDRANVIEFRISEIEMKYFFDNRKALKIEELFLNKDKNSGGAGQNMGEKFLNISQDKTVIKIPEVQGDDNVLNKFFSELQIVGSEFGYRSASEIELLITKLGIKGFEDDKGEQLKNNTKIDIAIMQKLLPKLHGSRKKLVVPLETLAAFCLVRINESQPSEQDKSKSLYQQFISEKRDSSKWDIVYSISFEKIERMRKNVIENGFTSYAEA